MRQLENCRRVLLSSTKPKISSFQSTTTTKVEIRVIVITSQLFLFFWCVKYVTVSQNEAGMNSVKVWRENERPRNLIISRCCFAEPGKEIYQHIKPTYKACRAIVLLFKRIVLLRSRLYLSSLLETLSTDDDDEAVNDNEKYEFAFTRSFSDHSNPFCM